MITVSILTIPFFKSFLLPIPDTVVAFPLPFILSLDEGLIVDRLQTYFVLFFRELDLILIGRCKL